MQQHIVLIFAPRRPSQIVDSVAFANASVVSDDVLWGRRRSKERTRNKLMSAASSFSSFGIDQQEVPIAEGRLKSNQHIGKRETGPPEVAGHRHPSDVALIRNFVIGKAVYSAPLGQCMNIGVSAMGSQKVAKGILNRNPFNLENDGTPWRGRTGTDGPYLVFGDDFSGMRAGYRDLYTKWARDGLHTTRAIITKFAPPTRTVRGEDGKKQVVKENDTEAYITAVCRDVGVGPDELLDFDNPGQFLKFGRAIMRHEIGSVPFPTELIARAMRAGYPDGHIASANPVT